MSSLNTVFMGTPEIASESLARIAELQKSDIITLKSVYTKPPVWNSKKKEFVISPVDRLARELGISVRTPKSLRNNPEEIDFLKSSGLDLIIVTAFGLILPSEILNIPKYGVLNLHPSLLPDLRGPSPIHYTILKRLKFGGVSIMAMDAGIDTGPVIAQQRIDVDKNEYFPSLYGKLSLSGAFLLAEVIKTVFKFKINMSRCGFPQDSADSGFFSLTGLVEPDELKVDFAYDDPLEIYAKARAFTEAGGAFFVFRNKKIKIIEAGLIADEKDNGIKEACLNGARESLIFDYCDYTDNHYVLPSGIMPDTPGIVISANKSGLLVSTVKKGVYIQLLKLKPEGKNVMNHIDFINGFRIKQGDKCR
jgi:methionyl-tRNA formyltransferase